MRKLLLACSLLLVVACNKEEAKEKAPAEFKIENLKSAELVFEETEVEKENIKEITISNKGEQDLILESFVLLGESREDFVVRGTKVNIIGGKSYELKVVFLPKSYGVKTAELTIKSNLGEHKIALKGKSFSKEKITIENPYETENEGGGGILSNNPIRLSRLAFDIDIKANTSINLKKLTINTLGTNPDATPENPDNTPFEFKIIIYENSNDLPGKIVTESTTKLEKTTDLEGRLLGGQSQLFGRELSISDEVILKATDKEKKYWLEIVCTSRPTAIETRKKTKVGLSLANHASTPGREGSWMLSGGQEPEDIVYKLECEKLLK